MRISLVLPLVGLAAASCWAQEYRGTFSGSVTDPQGSAIPKVTIIATEIRTGTKSTATSQPTGEYTLPFLAPGEYDISAEAPGFKRTVRHGLKSVSYTHLDVYKRQQPHAPRARRGYAKRDPLIGMDARVWSAGHVGWRGPAVRRGLRPAGRGGRDEYPDPLHGESLW